MYHHMEKKPKKKKNAKEKNLIEVSGKGRVARKKKRHGITPLQNGGRKEIIGGRKNTTKNEGERESSPPKKL